MYKQYVATSDTWGMHVKGALLLFPTAFLDISYTPAAAAWASTFLVAVSLVLCENQVMGEPDSATYQR